MAGKLAPLRFIQTTGIYWDIYLDIQDAQAGTFWSAGGDQGRLYGKRGLGMVRGPTTEEGKM